MSTAARIWLLLGEGGEGSHVWSSDPDPSGSGEHDAVEYVRADVAAQAEAAEREWAAKLVGGFIGCDQIAAKIRRGRQP